MILQALCEYYERKAADPESGIAPLGFEWKEIPFVIVIDKQGNFRALEDTRTGDGKRKYAQKFLVPKRAGRSSGIESNLLWDNLEYCVGANPAGDPKVPERAHAFMQKIIAELPARSEDWRVDALLTFLENDPVAHLNMNGGDAWPKALSTDVNVTIRIQEDTAASLVDSFHDHIAYRGNDSEGPAFCLASGRRGRTLPKHQKISGVRGAQKSGAALVSFNEPSYCSFGKKQNFNAPVSSAGEHAYTTALNHLLDKDSKNKTQVGDATAVFWSERRHPLENAFASLFVMPPKDDPDRDVRAVNAIYHSIHAGSLETSSPTRFYVLGLAPNAARLSVRFWYQGTVGELTERMRSHFDDLEIERSLGDVGHYALFWVLSEIAFQHKVENVPPALAGGITRAFLEGTPYPAALLQQVIRRLRADRNVTRIRAGILKACLNRFQRFHPNNEKELTVSLDPENSNIGYRLGRLFAVLEKIQEDANPGLKATIRDRYYGAASASPVTAFPQLLKLKNHHLKKLSNPRFVGAHEKRLTEIFSGLPADMPAHLRMDDQARFAIGYYHQRQALFKKSAESQVLEVAE